MHRIAILLTIAALPLAAQTTPPGPGWIRLFNGKDLSGWQTVGKEKWVVEGGTIYGEAITKGDGFLKTEKTYKDFHIFLRYRCEADTNSGLFYHTDVTEDIDKIRFIQVEIDNRINNHTAGLHGDHTPEKPGGWIAWPAPEKAGVMRPWDWNEMVVMVEGNRTRVRLNGVLMIDFTHPNPRNTDGVIALQLHSGGGGKMRFKDIFLRDLTRGPNPQ